MTKRKLPLFHFLPLPHRPRASLSLVLIFRSSGSLWAPTQEAGLFFSPFLFLFLSLLPSLSASLSQNLMYSRLVWTPYLAKVDFELLALLAHRILRFTSTGLPSVSQSLGFSVLLSKHWSSWAASLSYRIPPLAFSCLADPWMQDRAGN